MLLQEDLRQITEKGITAEQVYHQLKQFEKGFPFLRIEAAAGIDKGIMSPNENERKKYINEWNQYKESSKKIVKFVPASGAASRMFKDVFAFVDAEYNTPQTDFEKKFLKK